MWKFSIILTDYGKDREENNHFEALIPKNGFNKDKNKLQKIRELLCDMWYWSKVTKQRRRNKKQSQ